MKTTIRINIAQALYSLLILISIVSLASCQSEEEHLEAAPYETLDAIISTNEITFDDIVEALYNEMGVDHEYIEPYKKKIEMASLLARKYKAHVISYHTTDPNGTPVIASGVVYYPQTGTPRGVIEAISSNKEKNYCPSKQPANVVVLQGMAGYIILVADLIGCGTTESMPIPYLYHDNAAKVNADFRIAATELVRNVYGRSMPSWTLVSGVSLAASEAWALARYYHKHPELGVQVNQVWMSGGAYTPSTVWEHQFETLQTDYSFIPNIIYSLNYYENLGIDLHNVFIGELREHYEEWCTGNMPIFDISARLGTDISQYLNLDFFSTDNPDYLKMRECVERFNIPNDWIPTCSIHVYHGRYDSFVPISSSDNLVDFLRSVGAKVEYVVTETGHVENCLAMGGDLMEVLYK